MNIFLVAVGTFLGTVAFSHLFHVPSKYYLTCGIIGTVGYLCYALAEVWLSVALACFASTLVVTLLSRWAAVRARCPVTMFLISGIFPLVPGAGIYWMAYYAIMAEYTLCLAKGMESLKIGVAIVLGIVFIFELPQRLFAPKTK